MATFRKADGNQTNTLDYVITDSSERFSMIYEGPPLGSSYQAHISLLWDFNLQEMNILQFTSKVYNYKKGKYDLLSKSLAELNWIRIHTN